MVAEFIEATILRSATIVRIEKVCFLCFCRFKSAKTPAAPARAPSPAMG